jgi:hypothetical protein
MEATADLVASAVLVAVTVTVCEELMELGALYRPEVEIVPTAGLRLQVTPVLVAPDTRALNC